MASRAKARRAKTADIIAPPLEQMRDAFLVEPVHDRTPNGGLNLKGMAYRRRPMIDILYEAGAFTESQHKALRHFRHHFDMIDASPVRDSLNRERGGSGNGFSFSALNAAYIVSACEQAVGSLADILRAVVIDDQSLSQWAMAKFGSSERRRQHRGREITVIEPKPGTLEIAKFDIRMAAVRVEAELAA